MKTLKILITTVLIISVLFLTVACGGEEKVNLPSDSQVATVKMESAGYSVSEVSLPDGAVQAISVYKQKGSDYSGLMAVWFSSEETAAEYESSWIDSKYPVKKISGVLVYAGTESAIKDFEK